ncbi:hypothetical protein [Fodinicola acaciae]|uniref:hypothetical protein n=1 Tax=Fodinicola acaciae TaxID=2681555 RepID=UPI0013D31C96|nr:hypothetical protein [Fodinicola acaciae]
MRRLHVETTIRCDLDELWRRTQLPDQHQRWDLRFTEIDCLPRAAGEAQRFRYAVGALGLRVAGTGVTAGERVRSDGTRTSVLRFGSPHPLSPIRSGSGFWRYVPTADGVRFVTGYDYQPGWGRIVDLVFRPLMWWATAWSFDRLRIWLETGTPPEVSLRRALIDAGVRLAIIALTWLFAPPLIAALATAAALLAPPLPTTPAARRCRRQPPDRRAARTPSVMSTLEEL